MVLPHHITQWCIAEVNIFPQFDHNGYNSTNILKLSPWRRHILDEQLISIVIAQGESFQLPINLTSKGRPLTWYVDEQVSNGTWREEVIPADIVGLTRPIRVFRGERKTNFITYDWHGDQTTFCPPLWWDLAIGSGACGLGCRACFLMLTHRIKRDPLRHLLYENQEVFTQAVEKWLKSPQRRRQHTLGVGIDRSDSLLYEGVMPHVRSLAPLFGDQNINQKGNRLILLTKSVNTNYLADVAPEHRSNIIVSFSLNPEYIADLWEGKYSDTGERITPLIRNRLEAALYAQELGYEIRIRVDPILTPNDWEDSYRDFVADIRNLGVQFRYWTLGTYREKNKQLDAWRERWGLPFMEWQPGDEDLVRDGTHWHLSENHRVAIYLKVRDLIRKEFPDAKVSLCKETHSVRKAVALCNAECNCLM
jgi:DNA repair photolyase